MAREASLLTIPTYTSWRMHLHRRSDQLRRQVSLSPRTIQLFLPGRKIPFRWNRPDGISSWYEPGSSLATTLAAGPASLYMYCNRAEMQTNQAKTNMNTLFRRLS
ncbi:uncharacterized protein F4822DRAFT_395067 [Hypoxylon trugodes]|uniref:uncharacterized protein n=1 Tax=Hypoxylon trugodes TaxID=326681 RepID=UPI00219AC14D|nr:uncharacterized protein F4822DRAFT_395067 [Hypoxylon trugodes]KAI1390983.1 hypothetical protein F4822DRAFT_395067 [Hypoxylon trugodes]